MIRAMRTAASGMLAQQTQVDTIANNIANANTHGFKRSRLSFRSLLYETIREPGGPASATQVDATGLQIGSGTEVSGSSRVFEQGVLEHAGVARRPRVRHAGAHARIGEGGMGVVYEAEQVSLQRPVALKVLPDVFTADADRLVRFRREAHLLAALNHPNIAAIYGLDEADGVQALVMELVEGEDLARRLTRGPIPLDEALPIAKQISEALEAAHEQGIIHRDLKPANIMLEPRDEGGWRCVLVDFGASRMVSAGEDDVEGRQLEAHVAVPGAPPPCALRTPRTTTSFCPSRATGSASLPSAPTPRISRGSFTRATLPSSPPRSSTCPMIRAG